MPARLASPSSFLLDRPGFVGSIQMHPAWRITKSSVWHSLCHTACYNGEVNNSSLRTWETAHDSVYTVGGAGSQLPPIARAQDR